MEGGREGGRVGREGGSNIRTLTRQNLSKALTPHREP